MGSQRVTQQRTAVETIGITKYGSHAWTCRSHEPCLTTLRQGSLLELARRYKRDPEAAKGLSASANRESMAFLGAE